MVHLSKVPKDTDVNTPLHGLDNLQISDSIPKEITTTVFGSHFAAQDLPIHEMPDEEMPKEVAYRMIKFVVVVGDLVGLVQLISLSKR